MAAILHFPAISSIAYVNASAQTFLGPIEENCALRKAQDVISKLLAVYASHVITIKIAPGQRTFATTRDYLMAALLPSSSSYIALLDLSYRRSNFHALAGSDALYKNMQRAINAGAVCERIKSTALIDSDAPLEDPRVPTASPLHRDGEGKEDEILVMVARGTDAQLFTPTRIEGDLQPLKALAGAIQLGFATLQLMSVSDPQVAAYGYGAFIYTIIPYAISSIINLVGALFTESYRDLTEVIRVEEEVSEEVENSAKERRKAMMMQSTDASRAKMMISAALLQVAVYLGIVGGITHFHPGISSNAQRGWFVSWAAVGTTYGSLFRHHLDTFTMHMNKKVKDMDKDVVKIMKMSWFVSIFIFGVPSIGGIVAMIQQYLYLYHC